MPAFVLGMVIKTNHNERPVDIKVANGVSYVFMFLVGVSMPDFIAKIGNEELLLDLNQPVMSWGEIAFHVVVVTVLSNLGKLYPLFHYRDRKKSERLAISIGMFTRGEVGAGIIFIAMTYNINGPLLAISVLTLVLNLLLTGFFIFIVRRLAQKSVQV